MVAKNILVAVGLTVMFFGSARAQTVLENGCFTDRSGQDQRIVASCTGVILDSRATGFGKSDVPYAYYLRGEAFERLGQYDRARDDFLHALKYKPDLVDAWRAFGEVSEKMGQTGQLQASLDAVAQANSNNPVMLNSVCWARATLGRWLDVALAECNQSLQIAPDNAYTLDSRCLVRYRLGDFANAMADCDAALRHNSTMATSLYVRGLAKKRLGYAELGNADIAAASALDSKIADTYAGYGVKP
jgi:tetratricopeptide (TPR) repeat protein